MNIMVSGATGFIGNHIVTRLLAGGHTVIALVRDAHKASHFSWHSSVQLLQHDLNAENELLFDRAGKPDVLIHAAWDSLDLYRDAAHLELALPLHTRFLFDLVHAGLKQCLVLGTCLEYGMQSGALHEALPCKPVLPYPQAKHLLHEKLVDWQSSINFNLQWVRLFYLYGAGQCESSLLAQLDAAIDRKLPVFDMSPGDQIRDYLPVTSVADIIVRIAENRNFSGTVNCCSGKGISVRELVEQKIQQRSAIIDLNTGKYPYPDYEPLNFWGDDTRLQQVLGGKS